MIDASERNVEVDCVRVFSFTLYSIVLAGIEKVKDMPYSFQIRHWRSPYLCEAEVWTSSWLKSHPNPATHPTPSSPSGLYYTHRGTSLILSLGCFAGIPSYWTESGH